MSVCCYLNCGSDQNLWNISNENSPLPFSKDFVVCNEHLEKHPGLNLVRQALVYGRWNGQEEDLVKGKGWNLEKNIAT